MKTYYLTLSPKFPSTHIRAGQPTNFEAALNNAIMCAKCQEKPKGMCMSECIIGYRKLHTIRANYEFWRKRFEKIAAGEAVLSIRQWVEQAREAFRDLCSKYEAQGLLLRSVRFRRDEHTDGLLSINLSYTEKEEGL